MANKPFNRNRASTPPPAKPVHKPEPPAAPAPAPPLAPIAKTEPAIRAEAAVTPAPTAAAARQTPAATAAVIAAPVETASVEASAPAADAAPAEPVPVTVAAKSAVAIAEPAPVTVAAEPEVAIVEIAEPVPEPPPEQPAEPPPDSHRYIPPPLENKYLNKEALRDRFWLRKVFMPIICYVGRLDHQKGVHLIKHGIFYALRNGAQFVLLGVSPDPRINEDFWHLKRQLNDNPDCHLEISFNEELSHLIYAGSDMMIMPSLYEPCGLSQMIALKYGTVPIVREVGGLADTVFDKDYAHKALHERNGFVFQKADPQGLESAMHRAIGLWYSYPEHFQYLVRYGMQYDYSWSRPGQDYLNIYEHIRAR